MSNFSTENSVKNSSASSIKIFENADFGRIRVAGTSDEPLFCLSDICKVLELQVTPTKNRLKPEGVNLIKGVVKTTNQYGVTTEQEVQMLFVNEQNLYRVIMRSDKPQAEPFQDWVCGEVLPAIRKTGSYSMSKKEPVVFTEDERMVWQARMREFDIRELEAKNESARIMLSIKEKTSIPEVAAIADAYATNLLVGKEVVALPEAKEKTYSATEIGRMLGVSSAKIGRLSNVHNLKTEEYGKWFFDKSRHSNKEVESFRYYGKAIDVFRKLLS